jgi:hypothetical protein
MLAPVAHFRPYLFTFYPTTTTVKYLLGMSQDGYFLLRARSPRAVATILRDAKRTGWSLLESSMSLGQLIKNEPKSRPGIVLSIPDYFPSDADELELYRRRLLAAIPLSDLAQLHDDHRGVFVFDPMVVEEHGVESYDEVIAACAEYGGIWFDPARPATEQNLPFEERETIELGPEEFDEILSEPPKPKREKPAKVSAGKPKTAKKSTKKSKPAKKSMKKSKSAKKSMKKSNPAKK